MDLGLSHVHPHQQPHAADPPNNKPESTSAPWEVKGVLVSPSSLSMLPNLPRLPTLPGTKMEVENLPAL